MNQLINIMPDTARVWIYMADRSFDAGESLVIERQLEEFVSAWAAHGKALQATGQLLHQRFIVFCVDEAAQGASGCSIDASVRFIKSIEANFNVDCFNRMLVAFVNSKGDIETIHTSKLTRAIADGRLGPESTVFNNLVQTKGELDRHWQIPLKESVYKRWL